MRRHRARIAYRLPMHCIYILDTLCAWCMYCHWFYFLLRFILRSYFWQISCHWTLASCHYWIAGIRHLTSRMLDSIRCISLNQYKLCQSGLIPYMPSLCLNSILDSCQRIQLLLWFLYWHPRSLDDWNIEHRERSDSNWVEAIIFLFPWISV